MKIFAVISFTICASFPIFADSPFHTEIVITSEFGALTGKGGERRPDGHKGLDCHSVSFYPVIFPIMPGTVIEIGIDDIYGKYVIIKSGDLYHKYSHGKLIYYSASGEVDVNTPLMIIGDTGFTDGIHLDIEVYRIIDNVKKYYDPEEYI